MMAMLLVPGECCPSRERLLAAGERAFVGSLPGVYSPMARQGAGITEGLALCQYFHNPQPRVQFVTYLATPLARMRLLSRMHSLMYSQGRSLYESLPAACVLAHMRPMPSVNPFCTRN
jgi:hypothetical protein